ncbi:MAG: xynB [Verrucomicrobiales bacterium]|nr:xynB [Verrucomicrobiales bacterium]
MPAGVGVNIHFVEGREQDLDLIKAAGFKWVRMDFGWERTEQKKGEYDFSSYDKLTANLEKRGLSAIYILDYGNHHYEGEVDCPNPITQAMEKRTASPQHPESIEAFARWAAAAAKHFRGKKIAWEIWNEPNIFFWKPKPDAGQYSALALATAKSIRTADKNATIIGPATSGLPTEFLETLFKSGVLEYLDAVSVHPYRGEPPETAGADYKKLRALIDRYASANRHLPILSGEWGYSSAKGQFSLQTQADYAVRQQLFNLLNGIPLSIWYDWKNDGQDPGEAEQNFGTVTHDLQPKPGYIALQKMIKELAGYRFERRLKTTDERDFVLVFKKGFGRRTLVYWTVEKPHVVSVGKRDLDLTGSPQYGDWR